ncbi:DUF624 domain-containing protein [Arthrobacter oryzae]|uniref:YesL family protein n=1 Tax=Arthrobacter oryzae TaxID=409290 RepID=UPI00286305B9|nr:DUF624 domain-containing protein [Arthrobacter oryzae]MDR6504986.1 putative membrane protein YesL [Arthrobacter oryzae]
MPTGSFSAKAYSFFDTLLWIACLNLLWIVFSVAGLGVLGVGPATAAAHILVRRRVRGEAAPLLRAFTREFGRNFGRGNGLALPVMLAGAALTLNWNYFSATGDLLSQLMAAGVFLAAILVVAVVCHLFPMFARYELPLAQYLVMSSRFALRHLAGTAILLFVTAAALYASQALPGLIPFFSIGAWLYVTGWLCDRFFAANDESVMADGLARAAGGGGAAAGAGSGAGTSAGAADASGGAAGYGAGRPPRSTESVIA